MTPSQLFSRRRASVAMVTGRKSSPASENANLKRINNVSVLLAFFCPNDF